MPKPEDGKPEAPAPAVPQPKPEAPAAPAVVEPASPLSGPIAAQPGQEGAPRPVTLPPAQAAPAPVTLTSEAPAKAEAPAQPEEAVKAPEAVPAPAPAEVPVVEGEDDDLERTIARRPVHSVQLSFDDGTHHFLVGKALVGRAPTPHEKYEGAHLIAINDPGRSISKRHIALTVQNGGVLVEDMHSLNGTTVITPEGTTLAVLPGAPVVAPAGSTVYYGDRSVKIGD